ncbi:MAG: LysR family transcriptional regulator [Caulobacteraceae bacterium]
MDLNSLQTFVAVVRARGFAAAARETDTPRSSVSLRMRNLEKALGVRLFKRSARAFALTAEGAELYRRSTDALATLVSAVADVKRSGTSFDGEIRVTAPADFPAHIVAAAIAEFRLEHPGVRFEVMLTNEVLDLISSNIDVALRIGASNPQDAIIRGAVDMTLGLYASRNYLAAQGAPRDIDSISALIGPQRAELRRLISDSFPEGAELPPFHIAANNFALVRELILLDQGVGLLPTSLCRADIAAGVIVPVLPDQFHGTLRLHLTYPSRADLSPKVNAFAHLLARRLGSAPG